MSNISLNTRTRPEAVIADEHVAVEPGQYAQTNMTVRNTGSEIAEYNVSMVPDSVPGPWMEAVPATFRLMPGREQQVLLRFQPPLDSSTDAGTFPYGVIIVPDEVEHQAQVVVEGDVSVGAIHALEVGVRPRISKGRWRGKHVMVLHNRGTEDTRVKLQAVDEDDALSLALAPTSLTVPARTTVEAFIAVRPRSPKVMGKPVDHPFQITYRRRVDGRTSAGSLPAGGELEAQVSASFRHKPLISPLLIMLGLLLIGLIVLLLIMRPWEKAEARQPPDPVLISGSSDGAKILVSWNNPSDISEILIQEVDCATADHVLPTAIGEPISFTPAGASQTQPLEPDFELGSTHCFQSRAVSPRGSSVWAPSPAEQVVVGTVIPSPEITVETEGCGVVVNWPQVEVDGDVEYVVFINDAAEEPVTGGPQTYKELDPGETRVFARTVVGENKSSPSATQNVQIPEDCAGGGEGGEGGPGGPGGEGGPEDTTPEGPAVVDLRGQTFLLILPAIANDDERWPQIITTWQSIAAREAQMSREPIDGVVGETVLMADNVGQPLTDRRVIYVRGYDNTPEGEAGARNDCAQLNGHAQNTGDGTLNFCRLIKADGTAENVAPADVSTTTTTTG